MTDAPSQETGKRFRSPPYPWIALPKAVERIGQLHTKALHHAVGVQVLADAWDFGSVKSSGLWATAAALLQYGLLVGEGSGDKRKFRLSEGAIRIVRDPDPESEKRKSAIRAAALSPKIFKELWDKFGVSIITISDVVLKSWLTVDRHETGLAPYSDTAADDVIRVYKESVAFAGVTEPVSLPDGQWETDAQIENDLASFSPPEDQAMEAETIESKNAASAVHQRRPATRLAHVEVAAPLRVVMNGDRLDIQASVDLEGLKKLQAMLAKYQSILEMMQPETKEAAN